MVVNNGTIEDYAPATLTGMMNGQVIYEQTLSVTDSLANGSAKYTFDAYTPEEAGSIQWTVEIVDEDPDDDVATATTIVKP